MIARTPRNDLAVAKTNTRSYSPYYYGYYSTYSYEQEVYQRAGQMLSLSEDVEWKMPSALGAGNYVLTVRFDKVSLTHRFQVVDVEANRISITPSQTGYSPGDVIRFDIGLEKEFAGWLYYDVVTGRDLLSYQHLIDGSADSLELEFQNWRHPVSIHVFYIDAAGKVTEEVITIQPELPVYDIRVVTDSQHYEPGDVARVTVTVSAPSTT